MLIRKISFFIVLLLFIWFPLQDTIISALYRLYPSIWLRLLLIFKELLLVVALTLVLLRKLLSQKVLISKIEITGFFYLLICLFYSLLLRCEGAARIAALTAFRSTILPVLFVLLGMWLEPKKSEIITLLKATVFVSIFSIGFGFIEMFVPVERFWNGLLNLYGYLTNVKGIQTGFIRSVPGNFWAFVGVRRMAGTFASPLALGYYLILPTLLLVSGVKFIRWRTFSFLFLLSGLFLTETRAAIGGVLLGVTIYYLPSLKKIFSLRIEKRVCVVFLLLLLFFVSIFSFHYPRKFISDTVQLKESRAIAHVKTLQKSVENVQNTIFVGKGFGLAGGWASAHGSKYVGAGESSHLSTIYQIGGAGFFIFLVFWSLIFLKIRIFYKYTQDIFLRNLFKIFMCLNIVYFLTGVISEQILTFTSVAHFWILTGAILGIKNWRQV